MNEFTKSCYESASTTKTEHLKELTSMLKYRLDYCSFSSPEELSKCKENYRVYAEVLESRNAK